MASSTYFVAVAGATGHLGGLIVKELVKRNAAVKAVVRPGTDASRLDTLRQQQGVTVVEVDMSDTDRLTAELTNASCVVCALQGLEDVIITAQGQLLSATKAAGVPRFIPSDFCIDLAKMPDGTNRNLDLRRRFHATLEASGVPWTTVMNAAFMELLDGTIAPFVNHSKRTVSYVGSATQVMDFTTIGDTAAFTAAAALDPSPEMPKVLRIAGASVSAEDIAAAATKAMGKDYKVTSMMPVFVFRGLIATMRAVDFGSSTIPPWVGMQYMDNMFAGLGKLEQIDNDRYPDVKFTGAEEFFRGMLKNQAEKSGK